MYTFHEACELISKHWKEVGSIDISAEEIFNYSPQGELHNIYSWYDLARTYFGMTDIYDNIESISKVEYCVGDYVYIGSRDLPSKCVFDGSTWHNLHSA